MPRVPERSIVEPLGEAMRSREADPDRGLAFSIKSQPSNINHLDGAFPLSHRIEKETF